MRQQIKPDEVREDYVAVLEKVVKEHHENNPEARVTENLQRTFANKHSKKLD